MNKYIIHTDGGSRGNPGPAAIGVVIDAIENGVHSEYSEYIGETTNNDAEYKAVVFAFKKLKQIAGKEASAKASVEVWMDSELIVRQLSGEYKVIDKNLQSLFMELWNLRLDFGKIQFKHIPREENQAADRLVNAALDKELNKPL